MEKYAIIVAGGSGSRMGSEIPKQFLVMGGKPILMHTVQRFFDFATDIKIILVLPESQVSHWSILCNQYNFHVPHQLVHGGNTRFQSVKNGLSTIFTEGLVAIHDGVRPLVTHDIIAKSFETAATSGNAVVAVRLKDSIRISEEDGSSKALDRSRFYLIQTPQTFRVALLKKAFETEELPDFTDDATVLERLGEKIYLIEGAYQNIKITTPEDLVIAEALWSSLKSVHGK